MNDYEYTFKQDSKEKKSIGASSRKMNRTGKGPIKFPSDYLTEAQKKKLNGPCTTYDMGKPISYNDFCAFPEDIQRLYLQGIVDKFHPDNSHIAELFGISKSTVSYRMRKLGVSSSIEKGTRKSSGEFNEKAWDAWIADGIIPETKEESKDEKIEVVDAYLSKLSFGDKPAEEKPVLVKTPDNVIAIDKDGEDLKFVEVTEVKPVEIPEEPVSEFKVVRELGKANEIKYLADSAKPNLDMIAALWGAYLGTRTDSITAKDVAVMVSISKLIEIINSESTDDDWKQLSAYAMLAGSH